jgi:tRNA(Ile)-lysidine synthase
MRGRRAAPLSATPPDGVSSGADGAAPIADGEFTSRMEALGPFEPAPLLAVAVSGGGDSLALLLLADAWARERGGHVLALTVDHALRKDSAAEAAEVAALCAARGIAHQTLRWEGPKPQARLMERAREARYALLENACMAAGILHLLVAHHADDQAETVALRKAANSGPRGLAGMAAQRFTRGLRLLRPLLDLPKARLLATCRARDQTWIEDPSNVDLRFARARLRAATVEAASNDTAACIAERHRAEAAAAALAACAVRFDPHGYAQVDREALDPADGEVTALVLARIVQAVGAAAFPLSPALEAALALWLRDGVWKGRRQARITAGRCVLAMSNDLITIAREARHLPPPVALVPGVPTGWDRRVVARADAPGLSVGALGPGGWESARAAGIELPPLPPEARASLPVLRSADGQIVDWRGRKSDRFAERMKNPPAKSLKSDPESAAERAEFGGLAWVAGPPAFPAAFTVVWPPRRIMF